MPAPTIYYIRHGETDWNAQGRLQGEQDVPLNDLGRRQSILAETSRAGCAEPRSAPDRHYSFASEISGASGRFMPTT